MAPACTRAVEDADPYEPMFVGTVVGDGLPDVPVCEANNHRRWFRRSAACTRVVEDADPYG